jgi:RND family efflux transporter MFP subunit
MASKRSLLIRILTPLLIILAGVLIMKAMSLSRKPPVRHRAQANGALVEVKQVHRADRHVVIESNGTVSPRYEMRLTPQVGGKVIWVHPGLVSGGEFKANDELVRIEPTDYEHAVAKARALVAQAEYQLEVTRANADIASREWDLVNTGTKRSDRQPPDPLVLYKPQLKKSEADLASAHAALAGAELNLTRTTLTAPYNCRVRSQAIAPGQIIGPGTPVASLYTTDLVEIEIGLSQDDLSWIDIPGAAATVTLDTGRSRSSWSGTVNRAVGTVDQLGRLARIVIQVKDPFIRETDRSHELSVGSFVSVAIEGRVIENIIPIPRSTLRENATLWVASADSTLDIRTVEIVRMNLTEAFISAGLEDGELLIMTPLSTASPGMRLRPMPSRTGDDS